MASWPLPTPGGTLHRRQEQWHYRPPGAAARPAARVAAPPFGGVDDDGVAHGTGRADRQTTGAPGHRVQGCPSSAGGGVGGGGGGGGGGGSDGVGGGGGGGVTETVTVAETAVFEGWLCTNRGYCSYCW